MRCVAIAGLVLFIAGTARAADLDECHKLLLTGRFADCIEQASKAIQEGAFGESWHQLKADAELAAGLYPEARKTLEAALERYSFSVKLRVRLRDALRFTGAADKVAELDAEIARLVESSPWRYTDAENLTLLGQLALEMGADAKQVQDAFFDRAKRNNPLHRSPRLALGNLALDKRDFALAADIFREGVKTFPDDAELLFGLALAVESSNPDETENLFEKIAEINPEHVPLLLHQADKLIAAEEYEEAEFQLNRALAVNEKLPEALAYWAAIAHLRHDEETERKLRDEALATWTSNPEVDHILGRELSQKYRFAEGAAAQRRALELDPDYLPAQKQLAQDLLRLGQEEEGWKLVDAAHQRDQYDVTVFNLLTLRDELEQFATLERDGFVLRMDAHEARAYGERALTLLSEAKSTLCEKYGVELTQPVVVEIFPNPADFAVRTFGIPGVSGYLGVCFGNVITANSPASQEASPANWESVLWHEFAHVVTLNLTRNRMPRWVSEGISVYEERQRGESWGERMNPTYRRMILGEDLTPIGDLSGAFLNPKSAAHVAFAYYESSLVIEYLVQEYGHETLQKILNDLGAGVFINEAIERHTIPLPELEEAFAKFARAQAEEFGAEVDWSEPELPARGVTADALRQYVVDHPESYAALDLYADLLVRQEDWEAALPILKKQVELLPDAAGAESPWLALAEVHRRLDQPQQEREALQRLAAIDDASVSAYLRLMEIGANTSDWDAVRRNALRMLAVDPLTPHGHRYLAQAAEQQGEGDEAIAALQSLLAVSSDDPAGVHFRLARLLDETGSAEEARRHVLLALEQAPRYREAQRLLLKLAAGDEANSPAAP